MGMAGISDILSATVTDGGAVSETLLRYSKGKINKAGDIIRNPHASQAETNEALQVMNDWRPATRVPLENTLRSVRQVATSVDPKVIGEQPLTSKDSSRQKVTESLKKDS